jgi:hypothetical protein
MFDVTMYVVHMNKCCDGEKIHVVIVTDLQVLNPPEYEKCFWNAVNMYVSLSSIGRSLVIMNLLAPKTQPLHIGPKERPLPENGS